MAQRHKSLGIPLTVLIVIILIVAILFRSSCCRLFCPKKGYLKPDTTSYVEKISWNVLFKGNVSLQQKQKDIENIKDSIRKFYFLYNDAYGTQFTPRFDSTVWCPCDSALFNLNFACVDASGKSAPSPPAGSQLAGKGDLTDVLVINNNNQVNEPVKRISINKGKAFIKNIPIDNNKILAIIDSGLDTTLFTSQIQSLIWHDPTGAPTLYNFLPLQPVSNFFDSGVVKHGSAVTSIVINAMNASPSYPHLMILRALDRNDAGSTFSVSCALSYAIQNHANIVNASLGYMGFADSILRHYIALADNHSGNPIQLFVAAGNMPEPHVDSLICSADYNDNLLTPGRLFYPACFSDQFSNITSVTQLKGPDTSCYYQYFSHDYISLGVLDTANCCEFKVDFSGTYYEGSSFATPFASGLKMSTMIVTGNTGPSNSMWDGLVKTSSGRVTKHGKYIIH